MIRVVFWDIDGTLTDDQIHKAKHRILAEAAGYSISVEEGMQLNGVDDRKTYAYLADKSPIFKAKYPNVEYYFQSCRDFFEIHATDLSSEYCVKARKGAVELFNKLNSMGIRQACVTSAPDWQRERNITALGIADKIVFIQDLSDVRQPKPKPSPDLYELAFEQMSRIIPNLQKSEILVIEDSPNGVSAARTAGFSVIHCRMAEFAPTSDKTNHHAFTFEQCQFIIENNFGVSTNRSENYWQSRRATNDTISPASSLKITMFSYRQAMDVTLTLAQNAQHEDIPDDPLEIILSGSSPS